MRLLVGLGNPGGSYARNRHNIGYMAADAIVRRHGFSGWRNKFQGLVADGTIDGEKLLVLKPETFMNLSGQSVAAAANFHKIAPGGVFVVHDELDLTPAKIRVKRGGGAAGHNGLKSIDAHLGPEYWRIRLGIGHPGRPEAVLSWVLGDFAKADEAWVEALTGAVAQYLPVLLAGNPERFMTDVARDVPKPEQRRVEE